MNQKIITPFDRAYVPQLNLGKSARVITVVNQPPRDPRASIAADEEKGPDKHWKLIRTSI